MGSKSPSPDKGWVGDEGVEESTRVPSDSSDVVSSGEDWEGLSSISDSESESESCGEGAAMCFSLFRFLVCQLD